MSTTTINVNASFTGLSDTPANYSGQAGKAVFVKGDETGLEFGTAGGGDNLFTAPLTLTANREHDMNGFGLKFLKSNFEFRATNGLSSGRAVGVRNHTDTGWLFDINNDGSGGFRANSKLIYFGTGARIVTDAGSGRAMLAEFEIFNGALTNVLNCNNKGLNNFDYANMQGAFDADPKTIGVGNKGSDPTTAPALAYKQYGKNVGNYGVPHFFLYNYITADKYSINLQRETTAVGSATFASVGGTAVNTNDTFDGYTIGQVVKALRNRNLLQ